MKEAQSTRHQVALSVIQGYNDWNIDSIMSYRAPNCIQQVLPASLSRPPMNNDTYRAFFSSTMPLFRNFTVTVKDLIEDPVANKVAIWASSTADTDIGPYANEYMLVLYFNSDYKVDKILEFVDSASSKEFFGKLMTQKGNAAGS
jgi:ketosteroid isomerase-like protein